MIRLSMVTFLHKCNSCDRLVVIENPGINSETREGVYVSLTHGLVSAIYFVGKALDELGQPVVVELVG